MQPVIHCPELLHAIDSTLIESESFKLVKNFSSIFPLYYHYSSNEYGLKKVLDLSTTFSLLHARVQISINKGFNQTINSSIPLDVLRYKMLSDGSCYNLSRIPSVYKPGYIVEGVLWTNGFYHLTRQEGSKDILDIHFYVDQYTRDLHNYES